MPSPVAFDSLDQLKEDQGITHQTPSEASGVQLVLTGSGRIFAVSDRDQVLPKHTQLGGFGAGQHMKAAECGDGIPFKLPLKDKTVVQIDETTMRQSAATNAVNPVQVAHCL